LNILDTVKNNIHHFMNNQPPATASMAPIPELHRVEDLATLKLLADPLKLRVLQAFAEGPRTTTQVAAELGENLTKLYRHVDALASAGLLALVGETRKRGTIERRYRAVARRFEVERGLLGAGADPQGATAIRGILRDGEDEIVRAFTTGPGRNDDILLRLQGKASPRRLAELRQRLLDWVDAVNAEEQASDTATETFGTLLAFYRAPPADTR
jgi:DNA-binding transcriptional ArsR family regulator